MKSPNTNLINPKSKPRLPVISSWSYLSDGKVSIFPDFMNLSKESLFYNIYSFFLKNGSDAEITGNREF